VNSPRNDPVLKAGPDLAPAPEEQLAVTPPVGPRELRPVHYLWIAAAVVVFALLIVFLGGVLVPFLVGAALAYLGHPAVTWAERRRVPRTLGTTLVVIVILALFVGLILVLVPLMQSEVIQLMRRLPELTAQLFARVAPWLRDTLGIETQFDLASIKELITESCPRMNSASTASTSRAMMRTRGTQRRGRSSSTLPTSLPQSRSR